MCHLRRSYQAPRVAGGMAMYGSVIRHFLWPHGRLEGAAPPPRWGCLSAGAARAPSLFLANCEPTRDSVFFAFGTYVPDFSTMPSAHCLGPSKGCIPSPLRTLGGIRVATRIREAHPRLVLAQPYVS